MKNRVRLPDHEERLLRREPEDERIFRHPDRLNDVVRDIFLGYFEATPRDMATYFAALMEADGEIRRDTREAIAGALQRGRGGRKDFPKNSDGWPLPLLRVECKEGEAAKADGYLVWLRRLDAAEALADLRNSENIRGETARDIIRAKFEISNDDLKKGTAALNEFRRQLADISGPLAIIVLAQHGWEVFDPQDPTHQYAARVAFIEEWTELKRRKRREKSRSG